MALIKNANTAELARSALVLDLGDLQRQADAIMDHARARAREVIEEAARERQRLLAGAAEAGHAQGLARGLAEGRAQGHKEGLAEALGTHAATLEQLTRAWGEAIDRFTAQREAMLTQARRDVVRLAALIAEKVTRRAVTLDESTAAAVLEGALALVLRPSKLRVKIHPADRPVVESALPGLVGRFHNAQHVELADDPTLERGSCVVAVADTGAQIDASIGVQLDRITTALLPDRVKGGAL